MPKRAKPYANPSALRSLAIGCAAWWLAFGATQVHGQLVRVPEGCGSEAEFRTGVLRLAPNAGRVPRARVEIDQPDASAPFQLRVVVGDTTRTLEHADCATLWKSALIIVAAAAPGAAPSAPEALPRHAAWSMSAAVGGGPTFGAVPGVGAYWEAQALAQRAGWGAACAVSYVPATTSPHQANQPATRLGSFAVRLGAVATPITRVRLGLGLSLQRWYGNGLHTTLDAHDSVWSSAVVAEAAFIPLLLGPASLELALLGQWALSRPSFEVDGIGPLYRVPQLAAALVARLGWAFF